jgi:phage baseplate assembly protein W
MSELTAAVAADPTADVVGRGFAWPLGVDHTGSIRLTAAGGDLDDAIRVVLLTAPGERVMRPRFGCRIWDLLFEPVNANLVGLVAQAVRDALAEWEPRIEVEDVRPVQDGADSALIRISIVYRVRATNDRRNLVYPFYVIPREGS